MAAGEAVVGEGILPGQAQPPPEEATQAPPPDVLDLLRNVVSVELSPADVTGAMSRGSESAPLHIGAIVATRCTEHPDDFEPYRRHMAARERAAAATRSRDAHVADKKVPGLSDEEAAAVARYEATLGQVRRHSEAFDSQYRDGERIDRGMLGDLYDVTDALEHPAVVAMENALTRTRDQSARTALIGADRIVRFMVNAAVSQEAA